MARKKELTKDEVVKKEIRRLKRIYKDLDDDKKKVCEGLIEEAAFMRATLADLRATIDREGAIDEMPQGEYSILREHPAAKLYNTMIQRYSAITKQLSSLLPEAVVKEPDDGFDSFAAERDAS
jgi:hypothetical protein